MKQLLLLGIILFTTQINAQWFGSKAVKGNNNFTTETRKINGFDQLNVTGFFEITLTDGNEESITLEGESNLLELIETEVNNDKLTIKTEKYANINPNKRIKITIPFKEIQKINLTGSSEITSNKLIKNENFTAIITGSGTISINVEVENLESRVTGSGELNINGKTKNFEGKLIGSGKIIATDLSAENVEAGVSGSGKISINCERSLYARVTGSGKIKYLGNPEKEDTNVLGSGRISSL